VALPFETDAAVVPASTKQWCAIRSPPLSEAELVFDGRFFDHEHNRLLNSACFIEEMTGEEREQHWMMLGREKGMHSAREWKMYYEKIIRPTYLTRTQKAEASPATTSTNATRDGTVLVEEGDTERLAEAHTKPVDSESSELEMLEAGTYEPSINKDGRNVVSGDIQTSNSTVKGPEMPDQAVTELLTYHRRTNDSIEAHQRSDLMHKTSQASENILEGQISSVAMPSKVGGNATIKTTSSPAFSDLKTTIYTPNTNSTSNAAIPPTVLQSTTPLRPRSRFSSFPVEASHILNSPDIQEISNFHTILITNIGSGVSLAQVLSNVRGGRIVKATFLKTKGMKTLPAMTTNSAMIEFLNADDAAAAVDMWVQEQPVTRTAQAPIQPLHATLLPTPTRPLHPKLEYDMTNWGLTRVFYIVDYQQKWTLDVVMQQIMLRDPRLQRPLVAAPLGNKMLFFEFADVRDAAMAWEVVERDQRLFRGVKKGFLPDPCSGCDDGMQGEKEASSGSDADDEGDGGSTAVNTPVESFEADGADDMIETDDAA
jgi:hypothetical protein